MACKICKAKTVHEVECSTKDIFVSELGNIDLMLAGEVKEKMKEYEENFNKYESVGSTGHR